MDYVSGIETVFRNFWYPTWRLDQPAETPTKVDLVGEPIVVFGSGDSVGAVRGRCPHRGADLSKGFVQGNALVCPYHGMRFGPDASCAQKVEGGPSVRLVQSRLLNLQKDRFFLWASPSTAHHDMMRVAEHIDITKRYFIGGPMFWSASAPQMVDNFLDVAHFPFVHKETLGAETTSSNNLTVLTSDELSFSFTYRHLARRIIGKLGSSDSVSRTLTYRFIPPFNVSIRIHYDEVEDEDQILLLVVPLGPGRSMFYKIVSTGNVPEVDVRKKEADLQQAMTAEDREVCEALPDRMYLGQSEIKLDFDEPGALLREKYARIIAQ
ncbi:Rieske 2Fe-2S domain-containing protein [Mesorhizobium sp. B2-3-15]|uniref:Rieske 2Fe-2S domain-containing protein n=1 Tax=Mesorhizobium sp. B2-3-15 TaxID=2589949 RepID=UPI00112ECA67|nr:Rieske 2Fe-2S domain-containing protein [Mesorhizobium sp. B2-3-15]TPL72293.1 Rieske 2Fe-2S domain-containing protein [Mesorhizobium sp. B2-3-15]